MNHLGLKVETLFRATLPLLTAQAVFCSPCPAFEPAAQKNIASHSATVMVADGRLKLSREQREVRPKLTTTETKLINKEVLPAARDYWNKKQPDSTYENYKPLAALNGSFTAPGTVQKVLIYQLEQPAPLGRYGLVILQNNKILQHYCYLQGYTEGYNVLPDLNNDGCNEITFQSWSMHQGYRHGAISIMGPGLKKMNSFGWTEIADDDLNTNICYKFFITAKTGKQPQFFSEKYQKVHNKWTIKSRCKAIKLENLYSELEFVPLEQ